MAIPVGFQGANDVLRAQPGTDVRDLEILRTDDQGIVSCWRLTPEELEEVNKTRVVWFSCMGTTHPPISISGRALVHWNGLPSVAEPIIPIAKKGGDVKDGV